MVVESIALVQRRFGLGAVADLRGLLAPLAIHWIDADLHELALASMLARGRRTLSLVDTVSFEMMRLAGIRRAFVFDEDFRAAGFEVVPA